MMVLEKEYLPNIYYARKHSADFTKLNLAIILQQGEDPLYI